MNKESATETAKFWNEKARRNVTRPNTAVGVDDPFRNRSIEKSQQAVIPGLIRSAVAAIDGDCERVLDLGCRVGRWITTLDAYFSDYHGVDISSEMLDIARQEHPEKKFSILNDLKVDSAENSIDFALCVAVLHHNIYVNQDVMLAELSRIVRPGGGSFYFLNPMIRE